MKVIVAGSRGITSLHVVAQAIEASGFVVAEVVSGTARGVDRLGESWARRRGVPVVRMPAEWDRFGRSAGYRRNEAMAEYADALVAVWDGVSRGTGHMIDIARRAGLAVYVWRTDGGPPSGKGHVSQGEGGMCKHELSVVECAWCNGHDIPTYVEPWNRPEGGPEGYFRTVNGRPMWFDRSPRRVVQRELTGSPKGEWPEVTMPRATRKVWTHSREDARWAYQNERISRIANGPFCGRTAGEQLVAILPATELMMVPDLWREELDADETVANYWEV